jgi:hypothetical protein
MIFFMAGGEELSSVIKVWGVVSIETTNGIIISMGTAVPFGDDPDRSK